MAQFKSDKTDSNISNISNKENIGPDLSLGAGSFQETFQPISSFGSSSLVGKKLGSLSLSGPSSISSLGALESFGLDSVPAANLPVRLYVSNLPFRYRSVFSVSGSPS